MDDPIPPPGYKFLEYVDFPKVLEELKKCKTAIPGIPNSQGQTPIFKKKEESPNQD